MKTDKSLRFNFDIRHAGRYVKGGGGGGGVSLKLL